MNSTPHSDNSPAPLSRAEQLRAEYIQFVDENRSRSPERQKELDEEIERLRANENSFDLLSVIVRYNYEDGFYDKYPLILEDLRAKGQIPQS